MSWFKRNKEGITTTTSEKKEVPEGLWSKCSNCKTIFTKGDLEKLNYVCNRCSHHERIGSEEYFSIIFDKGKYSELNAKVASGDPLEFEDTKKYPDRLKAAQEQANQLLERKEAGRIQSEEIAGAYGERAAELEKTETLFGMAGERLAAANNARKESTDQLVGGLGDIAGGALKAGVSLASGGVV